MIRSHAAAKRDSGPQKGKNKRLGTGVIIAMLSECGGGGDRGETGQCDGYGLDWQTHWERLVLGEANQEEM